MQTMNWKILAIPVSIIPFVLIAVTFNISLDSLFAIVLLPIVGAALAMCSKLFTQGLKFNYLVKHLLRPQQNFGKPFTLGLAIRLVPLSTLLCVGCNSLG